MFRELIKRIYTRIKFREINLYSAILLKELNSRNFLSNMYRVLDSIVWKLMRFSLTFFWQKFRENNVFTKEITRVNLTKYFFGETKFYTLPHYSLIIIFKPNKNSVKSTFLLIHHKVS